MTRHLQVLLDEDFQGVLVLEDDLHVHAEKVLAVGVLAAEIAGAGEEKTRKAKGKRC